MRNCMPGEIPDTHIDVLFFQFPKRGIDASRTFIICSHGCIRIDQPSCDAGFARPLISQYNNTGLIEPSGALLFHLF